MTEHEELAPREEMAEPAQPEEKTLQPLLLHSLAELREIWQPLLDVVDAHSVTEVGSEAGPTTRLLVEHLAARGGRLVVVDPAPGVVPEPVEGHLEVEIVRGASPAALEGLAPTAVYLIDGDHNYHVVSGELRTIAAAVESVGGQGTFPLLVMHDIGWPWGRRDLYYDPEVLPEEGRHRYSYRHGVVPGDAEARLGEGFRGEGFFAAALHEGGPRNGVRTAVEDFLVERPHLAFRFIPSIFGLGVLWDTRATYSDALDAQLAPFADAPLLHRLERNRIEMYLRVVALQDEQVAARRQDERDWARMDVERSAWSERELALLNRIAELEDAPPGQSAG